jgi:hypothetical protein
MVKMTEQEYQIFQQKTGYRNPDEEKQREQNNRRKKMADIEKIQYYAIDLAYALDIGEIADMRVETVNGQQILRMSVIPKKHDEYKTVKVAPKAAGKKAVQRRQTDERSEKPDRKKQVTEIAKKALEVGKDFLLNPKRNKGKSFDSDGFGKSRMGNTMKDNSRDTNSFGDNGFGNGRSFAGPNFGRGPF